MTHPNFFANAAELSCLREQLSHDSALYARYETIRAQRETVMSEAFLSEEYANSVYSQHGNYYAVGAQLERASNVLGLLYAVEDDREAAERLRDLMLHLATFEIWTGPQNKDRDVPWRSDLSTTRIAVALSYGYDMIYDILTGDERTTIADAILQKGVMPLLADWVLPDTRIHALDSMGHNWWAVCIGLAGVALLPMHDRLPATEFDALIAQIEQALIEFLKYPGCDLFNKVPNYDEKGLFYESVGYFNYGTGELLRYLYHAERYLGRREGVRAALPCGMADAILSFAYPYTQKGKEHIGFLNWGDSASDVNIMHMVRYLRVLGYDTPALRAYASKVDIGEDLLSLLTPSLTSEDGDGLHTLPQCAIYPNSGYAITRSTWDNDATLLAIKSGYTWNHAHADAGSFVLYDKGAPLLIDSGTCPYGDPAYLSYFCRDVAHNVLLIDGQGQRGEELIRGNKFPGKLTETYQKDGLFYVRADATGPLSALCSRAYRNFLWLDDRILVIFDDVLCHEEHKLEFLLHFNGRSILPNVKGLPVRIANDRSTLALYTIAPEEVVKEIPIVHAKGAVPHAPGATWDAGSYLSLLSKAPARIHTLCHVLLLNEAAEEVKVESLCESERIGVRLIEDGHVREIWFNQRADGRRMHINSNHCLGDWNTDAYILMREMCGERENCFMVAGSYLRQKDHVRYASYAKETCYIE